MLLIGIDIGGTKCAVSLGAADMDKGIVKVLDKEAFPTENERGPFKVIDEICEKIDLVLYRNSVSVSDIKGIGISCGGPLDSKKGIIKSPPNLKGWDDINIVKIISDKYPVPVRLQNDANACALAEWRFGAARGSSNAVFLTFGTGMGAGLILDGRLYSGTNDMAGEVGHIRLAEDGAEGYGKRGSFEGFCSGGGIARTACEMALKALEKGEVSSLLKSKEDINERNLSAKNLAEAMKAGDKFALSVYELCAEKLGFGLSIIIDILNPEVIVIGSIYERNTEFFHNRVMKVIEKEALKISAEVCSIKPAELGDSIGDIAALAVAAGGF